MNFGRNPESMSEQERIARALDRELKGLPDLAAPEILSERVMARVRQMEVVSWWRQSWFEWPAGWRIAFVTAALVCVGGLVWVEPAGLVERIGEAATLGMMLTDWLAGIVVRVPLPVWLFVGTAALVSWGTVVGASVVCWQLVRIRK
jgi:hypothetical protein